MEAGKFRFVKKWQSIFYIWRTPKYKYAELTGNYNSDVIVDEIHKHKSCIFLSAGFCVIVIAHMQLHGKKMFDFVYLIQI